MRRYDIDWLRILVFALLIFYHVGMFFVPWGWHVKNDIEYKWMQFPMAFVNQWRLPILFVISGMGTWFALGKRSGLKFSRERLYRLAIPLVFGMLMIVPPQVYLERLDKGQFTGGYFEFWPAQAFAGVYPEGNLSWHHLWFLPYLLLFSLLLLPLFLKMRKQPENTLTHWLNRRVSTKYGLFIFIIPLYLAEAFLEPFFPVTHALAGDWFALVNFGLLFLFGFLLINVKEQFWTTVTRWRRHYLFLGTVSFSLLLVRWLLMEDSTLVHFTEAGVKVFNLWTWILVLFGYAAVYLNKPGKWVAYCNQAVYPFYILHQTITIIIGYYIQDLEWGLFPKFTVLVVGTFGGSWLLYEFLIRRVRLLWPLFGLKSRYGINEKADKSKEVNKVEMAEC